MAAVPLFRDTNMAAVTSRENTLYRPNDILNGIFLFCYSKELCFLGYHQMVCIWKTKHTSYRSILYMNSSTCFSIVWKGKRGEGKRQIFYQPIWSNSAKYSSPKSLPSCKIKWKRKNKRGARIRLIKTENLVLSKFRALATFTPSKLFCGFPKLV